ncbi:MAG: undecaprenyldiphospho-muramoylpentapeptide beta-N-acetylglucosaminyltransferase [Rhodospirillales bacterium]|nr:undecaprenyldiphospho-muramoylpentapeptide beta-N-acetylglucosaminyltransferase [Rhodospirillales bacterium]
MTDRRGAAFGDVLGRIERHDIAARSPSVRGPVARVLAVLGLARAVLQAARVLRRIRPAAAVGFGGYPSVPPLVASGRLGIPSVLHEQNAVLGRANRMLARRASAIATSFPETERIPHSRAPLVTHVGNPVRAAIAALRGIQYHPPVPDGPFRLLVTGGSQGARVFAEVVPAAVAALPETLRRRIRVSQQCRPEDLAAVERSFAEAGVDAKLAPFFEDMPAHLGEAHLVICRAGASTIAELAAAGRPAILVPLPIAADDHQSANGRALVAAGAALMIAQPSFTPPRLAQELESLMAEPAQLAERANAAQSFARPDAAHALADLVEGLIGGSVPEPAAAAVGGAA